MSKIYTSAIELIGKTPLLRLQKIEKCYEAKANIIAKVECMNLGGSIKDRVAMQMISDAEKDGRINKDTVLIEPTSGNTGIGLAAVSAALGYRCIIVMPDTMSKERRQLITSYGAELVLSDGKLGMQGAVDLAEELSKKYENSFITGQFVNPSNKRAHYLTTAPEIYEDMDGKIDVLVAGVGTGGTISGIGEYLKEKNPSIKVVAVEPKTSPLLSEGYAGPHDLQGIGANFIPEVLNTKIYDEIVTVSDEEAYQMGRAISQKEGLLVGISAGAAVHAAVELSKREEYRGKNIVVIIPDTGSRYLSTKMFSE